MYYSLSVSFSANISAHSLIHSSPSYYSSSLSFLITSHHFSSLLIITHQSIILQEQWSAFSKTDVKRQSIICHKIHSVVRPIQERRCCFRYLIYLLSFTSPLFFFSLHSLPMLFSYLFPFPLLFSLSLSPLRLFLLIFHII